MTKSKDVLTYYNERNKAFDKLPGMTGAGYYVIGDAPGFIDLYMKSGTQYDDDEGVEFGFKSLEDAAKYVNIVTGRNAYKIGMFNNPLNLKDHDDIHFIQLNADAMEYLKKLIEEPNVEILPYSTDDFVLKGSDAEVSQIQKKYKLLSSSSADGRPDRYGLVKYKDNDYSQGPEGILLPEEPQAGPHTVGYSYKDLMKLGHAARRDNYQYKYNNQNYWENEMNIYEQLNKIDDNDSLSEKYNVKNTKELKKLKESISSIKIPDPWNKYLEVYDYTPENDGEYTVGDRIGEYTVVAHLVPKAAYEDQIDSYPMLFRNKEGLLVGETSHDRVYPLTLDMFGLSESFEYKESLYSNRVEGNKRYFATMGEKIRYALLDVIRAKGYIALYTYINNQDPVSFSAYDTKTTLEIPYEGVRVNIDDTFDKISEDLQQQFIQWVSQPQRKGSSKYTNMIAKDLWNNEPVDIDGRAYARLQDLKKKLDIN